MKNQHYSYVLLLNLGMLCISTSGPLGRFIPLPPPLIIWSRALVAFLVLGAYCVWKKENIQKEFVKNSTTLILSGTLLTVHWVTYFFALQWSGVAIGMLSMFTFPIITVFLEPLFFKTKLHPIHLLFGVLILIGIDYGTIANGSNGERVFSFTNSGSEALIIKNVQSSCGCTIPKKPEGPIAPGETSEIIVRYDTKRTGPFRKTITVTTNVEQNTIVALKIKGTVLPKE